jgi:DNA-binding winged helix-turn-helix (wHTH) protein
MRNFSEMRDRASDLELDLLNGRLLRAGLEVHLRPKTWELLRHLAERPFQLISRDELVQALWPHVVVCDDSLVQCVVELRRALGDAERRLVRTVARRGYRLDAELPSSGRREMAPLPAPPTSDFDVCLRDGWVLLRRLGGRSEISHARCCFERAHQLDDASPDALSGLALSHVIDVLHRWSKTPRWQTELAREAADAAISLGSRNALAHHARAHVALLESCHFEARLGFRKALELDPALAHAHLRLGVIELETGHAEHVSQHVTKATLAAGVPSSLQAQSDFVAGMAAFHLGDDARAESLLRRSLGLNPHNAFAHQWLAALGAMHEDARTEYHLREFRQRMPGHTIGSLRSTERSWHPVFRSQRERLYEGLRRAGLPT